MKVGRAAGTGAFAAAACVACCAPPIIGALGITAGLAATAGVFVGLAGAVAVVLLGATWIGASRWRWRRRTPAVVAADGATDVIVAAPVRRSSTAPPPRSTIGDGP